MMSKYAGERHYDYSPDPTPRARHYDHSPDSTPRGRRYVLENLNERVRKNPGGNVSFNKRDRNDNYTNLKDVPSSQHSVASYRSNKTGPIGSSNKVMPTEPIVMKGRGSPRKNPDVNDPWQRPYVDPLSSNSNKSPRTYMSVEPLSKSNRSPRSPRKDVKNELMADDKRQNKGLSPRDEYMVTKLYDKEIIYLRPSDIRYTHDQITAHFNDGRTMLSTFVGLLYGKIGIKFGDKDVSPIEVMQTEEKSQKVWYVVNGNRRLYVFKKLQKCGAITNMQVVARKYDALEMDKQFLTRTQGRTISVVNDSALNTKMAAEVRRWKEWKAKQPTANNDKKQTKQQKKKSKNQSSTNDKSKY